jgi:hypothetical protein
VASAGKFNVGANIGVATGGQNAASLNDQLVEAGIEPNASTSGDIRTGWQSYITYQHEAGWGIELAYVDLGKATVDFEGIEAPIDELIDAGIGNSHPRTAKGAKLSATYRFELNKKLQLQAKLGGFDWDADYTLQGYTSGGELVSRDIEQSGTDLSVGAGLVHTLTNTVSAHIDWDYYPIDEESVNIFTLGISYWFY